MAASSRRREPLAWTLRKEGPGLDLPVAMGVLAATAQVPAAGIHEWAFAGEQSGDFAEKVRRGTGAPPRTGQRSQE
jgi:predicted ATPase with chaperone activity